MALNFPANPLDGEIYPDPAVPGSQQYVYNSTKGTWLAVLRGVERVRGQAPITVEGSQQQPVVGITPATPQSGGFMTAQDKAKLDSLTPASGTVTEVKAGTGLGAPATGDSITTSGTLNLLPANANSIGGVKAGTNVAISADGSLTVKASTTTITGAVKPGNGLNVSNDGTLSLAPGSTYQYLDSISNLFNGSTTDFQLTSGGVPFAPSSQQSSLIFVGGIIQSPAVNYSISGSTITFTTAPPAGTSFYGISLT